MSKKNRSLENLRNFGMDSLDLLQSPFNVAKDVLNIPVAGFQDLSDLMKSDDENMLGRSRSRRGRKSKKSKAMKSKKSKSMKSMKSKSMKSMKSKSMKSMSAKLNNPKKKASCKVRHMVWVKKSNKKRAHCRKHKSKM